MQSSQLAHHMFCREMNFWVLSLDYLIIILVSIVNVTRKFLKDKEWFKFGVVMTPCHYVIFNVIT